MHDFIINSSLHEYLCEFDVNEKKLYYTIKFVIMS